MNRLVGTLGIVLVLSIGNATAQNTFPASGNVGIGTTAPSTALTVVGDVGIDIGSKLRSTAGAITDLNYIQLYDGNGGMNFYTYYGIGAPWSGYFNFYPAQATSPALSIVSNGDIGIGTTLPGAWSGVNNLDGPNAQVLGDPTGSTGAARLIINAPANSTNPSNDPELHLVNGNAGANQHNHRLYADTGGVTLDQPQDDYSTSTLNMFWGNNGNVGIGTTTPHSALEINGNITLTPGANGSNGANIAFSDGTVQSTAWNGTTLGGDYAESIDVLGDRAAYEPGDVIVIDDSVTGKFDKSDEPYSKLVAGVYSTKPGLVGRRLTTDRPDKAAEVPMAMMGIVPTKVNTENGAISRGDLLVSSSRPGYAMKGTDRERLTGAVIGKALGPLQSGSGVIEVLISPQ